jgi:hypothetical protein
VATNFIVQGFDLGDLLKETIVVKFIFSPSPQAAPISVKNRYWSNKRQWAAKRWRIMRIMNLRKSKVLTTMFLLLKNVL